MMRSGLLLLVILISRQAIVSSSNAQTPHVITGDPWPTGSPPLLYAISLPTIVWSICPIKG